MPVVLQPSRYVIFANGTPPSGDEIRQWLRSGDVLVCADGGARVALRHHLRPTAVIGDFDSLTADEIAVLMQADTPLIRFPSAKNETDLELALLLVAAAPLPHYAGSSLPVNLPTLPLCAEIIILGALGGRSDQTLANMLLMCLPALQPIRVILVGGGEQITRVTPFHPAYLHGGSGDTVSLLPLGGDAHGVTTIGLAYPLQGETLFFGPARGISNVLLGETASVSVTAGQLFCILSKQT